METINVLVLFALVFSLIGNLYLWFRFKRSIEIVEDVVTHLERVRKERDDMKKTIAAIHEMYQKELQDRRDMFCRYLAEKKRRVMDETSWRHHKNQRGRDRAG